MQAASENAMMEYSHAWSHLTDLPTDWHRLACDSLPHLAEIWREERRRLDTHEAYERFNDKLSREWAIETGIIENVYQIDRGVTILLVEHGLHAALIPYGATDLPPEEVIQIVQSHKDALDGLFSFVKGNRNLSKGYLCELHQQLLEHQQEVMAKDTLGRVIKRPLRRGAFKLLPNNPSLPGKGLHEYCPPEHVDAEMDRLLELHEQHEAQGVPVEIESAWLHHRFTQIHPFEDGNGRVARAIASLVFIRKGMFPLLISREERAEYLEALSCADRMDMSPLVNLFARVQRKCLRKALSISDHVIQTQDAQRNIIHAAIAQLHARKAEIHGRQKDVFGLSHILEVHAQEEFSRVASLLHEQLQVIDNRFQVLSDTGTDEQAHYFSWQIGETAKRAEYFADIRTYARWIRLRIFEARQTSLILSFHCLGTRFTGTMACSAFLEFRETGDRANHSAFDGPHPISDDIFQFTYLDKEITVKDSFARWLSRIITLGLEEWRRQI